MPDKTPFIVHALTETKATTSYWTYDESGERIDLNSEWHPTQRERRTLSFKAGRTLMYPDTKRRADEYRRRQTEGGRDA